MPAPAHQPRDHDCTCLQGEHAAEVADKLPAREIRPPNIMHVLDEDSVSIASVAVDGRVERHENILGRNSGKSVYSDFAAQKCTGKSPFEIFCRKEDAVDKNVEQALVPPERTQDREEAHVVEVLVQLVVLAGHEARRCKGHFEGHVQHGHSKDAVPQAQE